jgi:hypothetical protein
MGRKIFESTQEVISVLPERTQDIIKRRRGIGDRAPETLESIGRSFGITRERVRQIEAAGLALLKKPDVRQYLRPIFNGMSLVFKAHGGVMEEDYFIEKFHQESGLTQKPLDEERGCIKLFLELGEPFVYNKGNEELYPYWLVEAKAQNLLGKVHKLVVEYFQQTRQPLSLEQLTAFLKENDCLFDTKPVYSYIRTFRVIGSNPFGEFGLVHWPEVRPRGIRDRSYLVLRQVREPLHFRTVAEKINEFALGNRPALPQTVHNELIKDERFVLVGRGIYALKEWGYRPGTVKDVLIELLKNKGPMSQEELVNETLKQKLVKANTIVLNLHNRAEFRRLKDGRYTLQKS